MTNRPKNPKLLAIIAALALFSLLSAAVGSYLWARAEAREHSRTDA